MSAPLEDRPIYRVEFLGVVTFVKASTRGRAKWWVVSCARDAGYGADGSLAGLSCRLSSEDEVTDRGWGRTVHDADKPSDWYLVEREHDEPAFPGYAV